MKQLLSRYHFTPGGLTISIGLLVLVTLTSRYSYLLFHSLVELFSVVTAIGIFILTWNSQRFLKNNYILIVGLSSLFIGLIDMLHMLAYKGMGVFSGFDANLPTQLWIAARYLQVAVLLAAPFLLRFNFRPNFLLVCFSTITTSLLASIFVWNIFPDCYLEGTGLTHFKITSEYVIVFTLAISSILLFRLRRIFETGIFGLLIFSTTLFGFSEIAFTSYMSVYGNGNLIGHVLRVISFYALYRAIIVTGLVTPFDLIFRELQQSKMAILDYNTQLESRIKLRTEELTATNRLLQQEIVDRKKAQQKTGRRVSQLKALRAIDIAISKSFDLKHTLSVVLEHVNSELTIDASAILLFEKESGTLKYFTGKGFKTNRIKSTVIHLEQDYANNSSACSDFFTNKKMHIRPQFSKDKLCYEEKFSSCFQAPLISKGNFQGILELYSFTEKQTNKEWYNFLEALAGQTAIAIDNATLFTDLESTNRDLTRAYEVTMEGWVKALDLRDRETEGHTQRVAGITTQLALTMGIPQKDIINVRRGALLHDIGKIGIPDSILNKPGPLDEHEWKIMRQHPVHAYRMLAPIKYLGNAVQIPYCHHERWDSSGYPQGLKKNEIPLPARIFAVVDVWDALCSDRPYRSAMNEDAVLAFIRDQSGKHFDPQVVSSFLHLYPQIRTPV